MSAMQSRVTIPALQRLKKEGRKIVGVVAWDTQIAQIADRAGVDLVSVGDSVGVNLWGQAPEEISLEEMIVVCKAVRRGVQRALVSADLPAHEQNVDAALRLQECGAEMVKILGSAELVRGAVRASVRCSPSSTAARTIPECWWTTPGASRTRAPRCSTSAIPGRWRARRWRARSASR
jgi:3-methyl-2-oxobutanoate hydroxymethyltransferase